MPNGHLDLYRDFNILGWLGSNDEIVIPFITANGKPCKLLAHSIARDDVAAATGLSPYTGFIAEAPCDLEDDVEFKLYALSQSGKLTFVNKNIFSVAATKKVFLHATKNGIHKNKNVVLIWKQHDAGLYGRRVDQIARALVESKKYNSVIILEIITDQQFIFYKSDSHRADSDKKFIYEDILQKKIGEIKNGIFYKTLIEEKEISIEIQLKELIDIKNLYATNTIFIAFPIITEVYQAISAIGNYTLICDMVDNQLPWNKQDPFPLLQQYAGLCHMAKFIIFNSDVNKKFFEDCNIAPGGKSILIPNWYRLPSDRIKRKPSTQGQGTFNILYSGNMNDRIDWQLLHRLHKEIGEEVSINLIGSADSATAEMAQLQALPRIKYHGPMRESDLISFANNCHLAIMPHCHDEISTYMNPLKLHMYAELGLHCIATRVAGIDKQKRHLTICENSDAFISAVKKYIHSPPRKKILFTFNKDKNVRMYLSVIRKAFKSL